MYLAYSIPPHEDMKTLVHIDEQLLKKAMVLSGAKTKDETIQMALKELIRAQQRRELISLRSSDLLDLSLDELYEVRHNRTRKHSES